MRFLPKNFKENVYVIAKILQSKIIKNFNPMERKFWLDVDKTFSKITEVSSKFLHLDENPNLSLKMSKQEKTDFVRSELSKLPKKMANHIYLPTNPDTKILEIIANSAITLQSAKKVPFIVSFVGVQYDGPDSDYLVNGMNIEEYVKNEISHFDTNIRPANNLSEVNTMQSKVIINKSTHHTFENNNNNNGNNYFNISENNSSNTFNILEDDPFLYDGEENDTNLSVPHIDIKIFNPKDKIKQEAENSDEFKNYLEELSNCTDDENEVGMVSLKKNNKSSKINDDLIRNSTSSKIDAFKNKGFNISCIFKVGDDLRQDSLALQVIHIFQEIFRENNLNLFVYPYKTISTLSLKHKDLGGFIEVVQDCDSRDQLGKTYEANLYDYFICTFGQENSKEFREARKNLIESLAAYAIISYILQIKDRHNGNILVDKYGHIIHIDFGFIFDISPGGNMKFERAAFKLTKEMIMIMQGTGTEPYATFVDLTIRAFLACRDSMEKLLDPVVLMFNSGLDCFRENSIKNFIDRFKLELNEDEAAIYMRGLISKAENNWRTRAYDFIQNKQNNIDY